MAILYLLKKIVLLETIGGLAGHKSPEILKSLPKHFSLHLARTLGSRQDTAEWFSNSRSTQSHRRESEKKLGKKKKNIQNVITAGTKGKKCFFHKCSMFSKSA